MRCGASWSLRVRCRGFRQSQRAAGTSVQALKASHAGRAGRFERVAGNDRDCHTDIVRRARGECQTTRAEFRKPLPINRPLVFASVVQETARALLVLMLARVNEPSLRAAATRHTPEKHRPRLATHGVVMAVQVTSDPVPHLRFPSTSWITKLALTAQLLCQSRTPRIWRNLTDFVNAVPSWGMGRRLRFERGLQNWQARS